MGLLPVRIDPPTPRLRRTSIRSVPVLTALPRHSPPTVGSVNARGEFECRGIGFAIKTGLMHIPRQVVTQ